MKTMTAMIGAIEAHHEITTNITAINSLTPFV